MEDKSETEMISYIHEQLVVAFPELISDELTAVWTDDKYGNYMTSQKGVATHKKVANTPTIFVNGARLNPLPLTAEELKVIFDVLIDNQYKLRTYGIGNAPAPKQFQE